MTLFDKGLFAASKFGFKSHFKLTLGKCRVVASFTLNNVFCFKFYYAVVLEDEERQGGILFWPFVIDEAPCKAYLFWYGASMKKIPAFFYAQASGREPVRDFLKALGKPDSTTIGYDIKTVEIGWPIGMPLCKHLEDGIWEIRSNISDERIARIFFFIFMEKMCLLHGFVKKTQKTPKADMDLAKKRKADILRGNV